MIVYLNSLRDGCLEAYTGILQGLKGDDVKPSSEFTCTRCIVFRLVGSSGVGVHTCNNTTWMRSIPHCG